MSSSKSIHQKVKELAQSKNGLTLATLKPNPREVAKRLIEQGALFSIGNGRYEWRGD